MSSGNTTTEFTRWEIATESAILEASALCNNAVLRRALAIAAYERVGTEITPDAGTALMIHWVMQACDELERPAA